MVGSITAVPTPNAPAEPPAEPDPQQLLTLAQADDDTYRRVVLRHLDRPSAYGAAVLRHPALRRRTRSTLGWVLVESDRQDRRGAPDAQRELWQARREAARAERTAIDTLPPPVDVTAEPGRRALQRLAGMFPDEWVQLQRQGARSLRALGARHKPEWIRLLREERGD
jgi:hypothetical protein